MLSLDQIPEKNANVMGQIIEDEAVLVLPDKGKVKVLNDVGAAIWNLIDGEREIRSIAAEILDEFAIDLHTAEVDTLHFIEELTTKDVVSIKS